MKMREFCELVEDANGPRLQYTYPFRATIYESHYAYGGPEEGGWWYDALGDVVESHFVTCEAELDAVRARREALEEELNKRLTWEAEDRIGEALENFKYPRYE